MAAKAKVYNVHAFGESYLVMAMTKQGAARDLIEHLQDEGVLHTAVASGLDVYNAARDGVDIIGIDRYQRAEDPDQMPLDGVPEASEERAHVPAV